MRRWGIFITALYALIFVLLILPGALLLAGGSFGDWFEPLSWLITPADESEVFMLLVFLCLVGAQAALLFVPVDRTVRSRERRPLAVSILAVAFAVGLLTASVMWSVVVAIWGDDPLEMDWRVLLSPFALWVVWALVFFGYRNSSGGRFDNALGWLIRGSVLELLIVVPCHVIVRQREDCSAPGVTAFGIATGVAVMLLAFGPSVLFLYQKRLRHYRRPGTP